MFQTLKNLHVELFFQCSVYRISFKETYGEMNQPSGEWKTLLGAVLIVVSGAGLLLTLEKKYGKYGKHCLYIS